MSFTFPPPTSHLTSFLSPCAQREWEPFLSALDPNAHWVIAGPPPNGAYPFGIYVSSLTSPKVPISPSHIENVEQNVSPWKRKIRVPSVKALAIPINMVVDEMDIIGLKAIVEFSGYATQKSGKPYNNK
jgi:hypothetical protein